ncbi:MAG: hypothetical protein LBD12_02455 [Clostridiales Family XIII bacterium]|jgi:hypothetical protein|nr:hypothetical protein [Clostridiales Family XIII bacterium]
MQSKSRHSIEHADAFLIWDASAAQYHGGDQHWFAPGGQYRREAACGATTCANILAYFARTRPELSGLAPKGADLSTRQGFLQHMKAVYPSLRPGLLGLMPDGFREGAVGYAGKRGIGLRLETVTVPAMRGRRQGFAELARFLSDALGQDLPVAFLNLSNGGVHNLDSYHWVTLTALDEGTGEAQIVDNGRHLPIALSTWLKKTTMGGAFVVLHPSLQRSI